MVPSVSTLLPSISLPACHPCSELRVCSLLFELDVVVPDLRGKIAVVSAVDTPLNRLVSFRRRVARQNFYRLIDELKLRDGVKPRIDWKAFKRTSVRSGVLDSMRRLTQFEDPVVYYFGLTTTRRFLVRQRS